MERDAHHPVAVVNIIMIVYTVMYMLWFNFIPGLNFIFLCFGV